jgi:hypothetical protein
MINYLNYLIIKRFYFYNNILSKDILSIIIGSLLGDSYIEYISFKGSKIIFALDNRNIEYLMWFHKYLADRGYCNIEKPKLLKRIGKKSKIYYYYNINTYTFTSLDFIYDLFYKNQIKRIPKNIEYYLTPLSLSIWIQNNGTKVSGGLKLSTNSFTKEDILYLSSIIKKLYNLDNSIQSTGKINQYIIYFPKKSMNNLSQLVKPYILPSMYYKLK